MSANPKNPKPESLALKLWFIVHRTRDVLMNCEDKIVGKYGLTSEQFGVLAIMKLLGESVRVTDLAQGLERSTNSVSMIVDRMVKIGLVRRVRSKSDRRVVNVVMTSKGENALKPSTREGVDFIREILSPLSDQDMRAFVAMHETIKYRAVQYLEPKADIAEMKKNDITNRPDLVKRLHEYLSISTDEGKQRVAKKRKPKR
ncbi:MAG: MarR family winged helix-turn-helix transcriptional regulator [Dehalococcoidia bacterium]